MIRRNLTYYAERLDEYLYRSHRQSEGVATVELIGAGEESISKVVCLLNVKCDTSYGISVLHNELKNREI